MKIFTLLIVALISPLRGDPEVPVLQPVESVPKEIAGLEFSVVTQAEWRSTPLGGSDLVVQLRITNRGDKAIGFPTLDKKKDVSRYPPRNTGSRLFWFFAGPFDLGQV